MPPSAIRSEAATGNRNRALAHLAASSKVLGAPVEDAVDTFMARYGA